jgi:hypothetical protein
MNRGRVGGLAREDPEDSKRGPRSALAPRVSSPEWCVLGANRTDRSTGRLASGVSSSGPYGDCGDRPGGGSGGGGGCSAGRS